MKKIFLLVIFLSLSFALKAQYPAVVYDYENNSFNQGGLIPAETYFNINGNLPANVGRVEVAIYKAGKEKAVYKTEWTRGAGNQSSTFSVPVKFNLRSNTLYDIALNFHRLTSKEDKAAIKSQLFTALDGYVDGTVSISSKKIGFDKGTNDIMDELYQLVSQSLVYYEPVTQFKFPGFSDIVRYKIEQINKVKLSDAKINVKKAKKEKGADARRKYAQKLLNELKTLLHNESSPYVSQDAYVLGNQRVIKDAETEKTINYITLKGGYGLIYMSGKLSNAEYVQGMYAGVVLPLGKPAFAPKIIQNGSVNAGVFINNFEDANGEAISGPIVGRPLYLGLGYSFIKFIKLDVGGVFLQNRSTTGIDLNLSDVRVRPFVGLSAQIKFSGKLD